MPTMTYVPSEIGEGYFTDWQAPTSGDDGKAWAYNHSTGNYEPVAAVVPGGSDTHVQYNSSGSFAGDSGFTYGSGTATLSTALVVPVIKPASDSTTAVRVQNAAGSSDMLTVDTTTPRVTVAARFKAEKPSGDAGTSAEITGGVNPNMIFHNGVVYGKFQILDSANRFQVGTQSAHAMDFLSSNASRARLSADGKFFWGGITAATAIMDIAASTTSAASLRIRSGTAPTSPNDGDIWYASSGRLIFRRSSTSETVATGTPGSAFTQTYATADRTISAYTADNESIAYTGIDNAQGGTVYAQLSDLNNLRTAYENLRALAEDTTQALNAVIDDLQTFGISG